MTSEGECFVYIVLPGECGFASSLAKWWTIPPVSATSMPPDAAAELALLPHHCGPSGIIDNSTLRTYF